LMVRKSHIAVSGSASGSHRPRIARVRHVDFVCPTTAL
jgi:hypothetical protein